MTDTRGAHDELTEQLNKHQVRQSQQGSEEGVRSPTDTRRESSENTHGHMKQQTLEIHKINTRINQDQDNFPLSVLTIFFLFFYVMLLLFYEKGQKVNYFSYSKRCGDFNECVCAWTNTHTHTYTVFSSKTWLLQFGFQQIVS